MFCHFLTNKLLLIDLCFYLSILALRCLLFYGYDENQLDKTLASLPAGNGAHN